MKAKRTKISIAGRKKSIIFLGMGGGGIYGQKKKTNPSTDLKEIEGGLGCGHLGFHHWDPVLNDLGRLHNGFFKL